MKHELVDKIIKFQNKNFIGKVMKITLTESFGHSLILMIKIWNKMIMIFVLNIALHFWLKNRELNKYSSSRAASLTIYTTNVLFFSVIFFC
jgi:uncharacterized membrane protein